MFRLSTVLALLLFGYFQLSWAFETDCDRLVASLANGTTTFKTIGQVGGRLLVITNDDLVFDVSASALESTHRLYLTGAQAETLLARWPILHNDVVYRKLYRDGIYLTIQMDSGFGTMQVGHPHRYILSTITCHSDSNNCAPFLSHFALEYPLTEQLAFINSPEEHSFYTLDQWNLEVTKWSISNGSGGPSSPAPLYLCFARNSTLLTVSKQSCIRRTGFEFGHPTDRYAGFASHEHMYIIGAESVYIFELAAITEAPKTVNITVLPLEEFISCQTQYFQFAGISLSMSYWLVIIVVSVIGAIFLLISATLVIIRAHNTVWDPKHGAAEEVPNELEGDFKRQETHL